jgi:hypothetical protein
LKSDSGRPVTLGTRLKRVVVMRSFNTERNI